MPFRSQSNAVHSFRFRPRHQPPASLGHEPQISNVVFHSSSQQNNIYFITVAVQAQYKCAETWATDMRFPNLASSYTFKSFSSIPSPSRHHQQIGYTRQWNEAVLHINIIIFLYIQYVKSHQNNKYYWPVVDGLRAGSRVSQCRSAYSRCFGSRNGIGGQRETD